MAMRPVFEWSDAWVFASLRGAADEEGQIDFARLIGVADMLNHAIVTAEEVRRALAKLHMSGLVEVFGARVTTTALAETLHEKIGGMRGGAFAIVDHALRLLNAPGTRLPVVASTPDTTFVTEGFMTEAYERYLPKTTVERVAGSEAQARLASTQGREQAIVLARSDTPAALRAAREIRDPWYRAQTLAAVARWAPDGEVEAIAAESLNACRECGEGYQRVAAGAWPLRALVERGALGIARAGLAPLLDDAATIQPAASRSEALFLLFQACFDLDANVRKDLLGRLVAAHDAAGHWRSRRNLASALAMLGATEPALVRSVADSLADDRVRRRVERPGADREKPRPFF
jgi:hypothetical protein